MNQQMTVAQLFKTLVDDGKYVHGDFMCNVLTSEKQEVDAVQLAELNSNVSVKDFVQQQITNFLFELRGYPTGDTNTLSSCIFIRAGKSCPVELRYQMYKDCVDACLEIYLDWDNRFEIVNKLVTKYEASW